MSWWAKLKENVGIAPPEEEPAAGGLLHHLDEVSTLNRTQVSIRHRLPEYAVYFAVGWAELIFSFLAESLRICNQHWTGNRFRTPGTRHELLKATSPNDTVPSPSILPLMQSALFFLSPTRFAVLYTLSNLCAITR